MKLRLAARTPRRTVLLALVIILLVGGLYSYKLSSLTGGLSSSEIATAIRPMGWHGLFKQPLYAPLNFVRSVIFYFNPSHGQSLTRLANVPFGMMAIIVLYIVARLWYGTRTAVQTGVLFACSAWSLHVSRLASYDVLYLLLLPALLLSHVFIRKYINSGRLFVLCVAIWLLSLFVPGAVWLVLLSVGLQREFVTIGWRALSNKARTVVVGMTVMLMALLLPGLLQPGNFKLWLGLPTSFAAPGTILKHLLAVPFHLFVRGPLYPELWLGRSPVLDIFVLAMCILGIYFFATNFTAFRSRLLLMYVVAGTVLISLGGPVPLSLLIPVLYLLAATGIALLSRIWLKTFPLNPLARAVGLTLLGLAVVLSCAYNLRAYFVAWPHNATTKATFHYRR